MGKMRESNNKTQQKVKKITVGNSALKSGLVPVLDPSGLEPGTEPVPIF